LTENNDIASQSNDLRGDVSELLAYVRNLPMELLVTTGRTGSDFFHSLLDGHPEIICFHNHVYVAQFWRAKQCEESLPDLVNEFIWFRSEDKFNLGLFKSQYEKFERHDQLGKNKNEHYTVNLEKFSSCVLSLLHGIPLTFDNFFYSIHVAYALAQGEDILKKKMIFYHPHHVTELKDFNDLWKGRNYSILCTIREPKNTLVSNINRWRYFEPETFRPAFVLYQHVRILELCDPLLCLGREINVLKLETLHQETERVLRAYCQRFKMTYFPSILLESTIAGKLWWGDVLMGKYVTGFNPAIDKEAWHGGMDKIDAFIFDTLNCQRASFYGYHDSSKKLRIVPRYLITLFLIPKLTQFEKGLISDCLKRSGKVVSLTRIAFFYIKRLIIYYRRLFTNNASPSYGNVL